MLFKHGHALIIGMGGNLPGTVADAEGLAKILRDPGRCAYPSDQVHLLTGSSATRKGILAALDQLAKSTTPDSVVIVYFTGHGYRVTSSMGEANYLLPYDYDMSQLYRTAIGGDVFVEKLIEIPAGRILTFIDACHPGGIGETKALAGLEFIKSSIIPEMQPFLLEEKRMVFLSSSREDELSFAGRPYSAFALALIEAFSGINVARKDGMVRVADVALHVREVVPGRTQGKQQPVMHFEYADNFAIAYYAGGDKQPKPLLLDRPPEIETYPGEFQFGGNFQGTHLPGKPVDINDRRMRQRIFGDNIIGQANTVRVTSSTEKPTIINVYGDIPSDVDADVILRPSEIRQLLETSFDDEELLLISQDLNIDYDNLSKRSTSALAREIVSYAWRRDDLAALVQAISELRPGILEERIPVWQAWNRVSRGLGVLDFNGFTKDSETIVKNIAQALGLPLVYETPNVRDRLLCYWLDTSTPFSNTRLPTELPLILLHRQELTPKDLEDIGKLISSKLGQSRHVALLVLFNEGRQLAQCQDIVRAKGYKVLGYDIIVIDRNEMQRLILAQEPQKLLKKMILSQVDLLSVSPYTITGPASDNIFFGRELELRKIVEHARTTSYAIIGGRRVGKSSLLGRLHRLRLPAAGIRSIYHDCAKTPSYQAFLQATIRDWRPEKPAQAAKTFEHLFQEPPADKPLVLLLDEADKLIASERQQGWPLFNALRSAANSGQLHVVLSGERTLREALADSRSPLFNFANEIILGPLDYRAITELVTEPMAQLEIKLENKEKIVRQIYDFTSGHPNVVQRLCDRLIQRLNDRGDRQITSRDVLDIIEYPKFQEIDFLQTFWESATPLEKITSLVMAQEPQTCDLACVHQLLKVQAGIQPSVTETKQALDRLIDLRSILSRSQSGYTFAVKAFPQVLAKSTTRKDLLMVLLEAYQEQGE